MQIEIPCWVLSTPRTGSTYLADLLNSTFLFGEEGTITETTGVIDRWTEYYCDRFFKESFLTHPPKINKIQHYQYMKYFNGQALERLMPNIRYVLLRRKDVVATAVSHYFVTKSHTMFGELKWNVYTEEERQKFSNMQVDIDVNALLEHHKQASKEYLAWNFYLAGRKFIELDYDDVVSEPQKSVDKVLSYMGLDTAPISTDWHHLPKKQLNNQKKKATLLLRKALGQNVIAL